MNRLLASLFHSRMILACWGIPLELIRVRDEPLPPQVRRYIVTTAAASASVAFSINMGEGVTGGSATASGNLSSGS